MFQILQYLLFQWTKKITVVISLRLVFLPDWNGAPNDNKDYWFNIEKEAGRLNRFNFPTRWLKKSIEKAAA